MATAPKQKNETEGKPCCGLVMPISSIGTYSQEHWNDVKKIITEAVDNAGFKANLVSQAEEIGIIQKRIIQNLYDNPIVVCDVSGKNPNVMFELGMRLAFDKPTIIIKDDETNYSFDTASIEHLEYPRSLRFGQIVDFKEALKDRILATVKKAKADDNYSPFLKNYGEYKVATLESKEVSQGDYIIEKLSDEIKKLSSNLSMQKPQLKTQLPEISKSHEKNLIQRLFSAAEEETKVSGRTKSDKELKNSIINRVIETPDFMYPNISPAENIQILSHLYDEYMPFML